MNFKRYSKSQTISMTSDTYLREQLTYSLKNENHRYQFFFSTSSRILVQHPPTLQLQTTWLSSAMANVVVRPVDEVRYRDNSAIKTTRTHGHIGAETDQQWDNSAVGHLGPIYNRYVSIRIQFVRKNGWWAVKWDIDNFRLSFGL